MLSIFKDINKKNANKFNDETEKSHFSVSMKLNVVNILIIISSILSIIGAYEIQLGGKMHELNYLHQKYITHLVKSVKEFEVNSASIENVESNILQIRDQPIACIELAGPIELFMMDLIGTKNTVKICYDDLKISDDLLDKIQAFKVDKFDKPSLVNSLYRGIDGFENSGVLFEPLVVRTVEITFLIVITIVIAKGFIVPIVGLFLSRSVAQDYELLVKTKSNLEEEKHRSALIQSERIASLTTMVAGMAHEINTPVGAGVTANSYAIELLTSFKQAYEADELTEKKFYNFIDEITKTNEILRHNLSRTSVLVNSFKQVSVDQTLDELQIIKMKTYLEQILVSLTPITKNTSAEIILQCDEELQAYTYGGALSQITTNLVVNAINHAFKNTKHGTLIISAQQSSDNEIYLSFKDNGCGISEVDKIHIFDPFFTTQRTHGGTGLGLHILYNLVVDKLRGTVSCTSKLNEGSQFDIYIPKTLSKK